jgi:predicted MFS family arabinose efflux permease
MTFRNQLRALPSDVWVLLGGTLINRFGSFVAPFLVIYLTHIGYSTARAGFALGAYGAGHIVASALGGHLADRIGRRHTIVLSMFGSAAAMLALSQMRSYGWIVALTTITAAMAELYRPASHALLTDLVEPEHRAFAFALYRFAVNLGVAAGPALAGFLAEHSFFYLFVGDAATSLAYGVIAVIALPQGLRTYVKGERAGEALRTALRDTAFVTFLAATFLVAVVDLQMLSTLPLHVTSIGLTPRVYGMLISLNGALIIAFELLIIRVTQRLPPRPVIALGYLLWGLGFSLTGVARSIPLLAGTVVIWTFGEMVASPMVSAYVARIAPERFRGRYMGLLVTSWSLSYCVGPPLGTLVYGRNPALLWTACGVLALISVVLLYTPRRPES